MDSPGFILVGAAPVRNRTFTFRSSVLGNTISRRTIGTIPYRRANIARINAVLTPEESPAEVPAPEQSPVVEEETSNTVDQASTTEEQDNETESAAESEPVAEQKDESATPGKRRRRRTGPKREVTLPLDKMTVGMELEGVVKSVTNYGAFIGGMGTQTDGLLHVSQLAAGFVENVTDIVNIGDKLTVRVLSIDQEKGNFSLTMKTAEEMAASDKRTARKDGSSEKSSASAARREEQKKKWTEFKYDTETFIGAKILSLTDFGAFCQLVKEDGTPDEACPTDGLIHISEISSDRVNKVADVLEVGQAVQVRIISVDRKRNRISLSMKQVGANEPEQRNFAEDIANAAKNQPVFKTSFELAFEKAKVPSK